MLSASTSKETGHSSSSSNRAHPPLRSHNSKDPSHSSSSSNRSHPPLRSRPRRQHAPPNPPLSRSPPLAAAATATTTAAAADPAAAAAAAANPAADAAATAAAAKALLEEQAARRRMHPHYPGSGKPRSLVQGLSQVDHIDLQLIRDTRLFMLRDVPKKFRSPWARVNAVIGQQIAQASLGSKELDTACKWWTLKAQLFLRRENKRDTLAQGRLESKFGSQLQQPTKPPSEKCTAATR